MVPLREIQDNSRVDRVYIRFDDSWTIHRSQTLLMGDVVDVDPLQHAADPEREYTQRVSVLRRESVGCSGVNACDPTIRLRAVTLSVPTGWECISIARVEFDEED